MADQDVTVKLNATGNAARKMREVSTAAGGLNLKMVAVAGAAASAAVAIGKFVADGIGAYADFDESITNINARTDLTKEGLDAVTAAAKQMGLDTQFSATEAADAMLQLVTSGSSASEAIALLPDVLGLAAAGSVELETAADALTDVMKQFGVETDNATKTVDTLVAASQSSSADVNDMIAAFENSGAAAAAFGLDVDTTAAALAVMAENGTKGSEAGTQFKSMLLNMNRGTKDSENALALLGAALATVETNADAANLDVETLNKTIDSTEPVSFFDEEGNARDFATVLNEINAGLASMDDETRTQVMKDLYGSYGLLAGQALFASDGIDAMQASMEAQNSAAEVAAEKLQSWDQQVGLVRSSIEGLQIAAVGSLVEKGLKPIVRVLPGVINSFTKWIQEGDKVGTAIDGVKRFLTGMLAVTRTVGGIIVDLVSRLKEWWEESESVQKALGSLRTAGAALELLISRIRTVVVRLVSEFVNWISSSENAEEGASNLGEKVAGLLDGIVNFIAGVANVVTAIANWALGFLDVESAISTIKIVLITFGAFVSDIIGFVSSVLKGDWEGAWAYIQGIVSRAVAFIDGILNSGFGALLVTLADFIGGLVGGVWDGLDQVVRLFQTAFHSVRVFLHGIFVGIVQMIEDVINGALEVIKQFIHRALLPLLAAASRFDPTGKIAELHDKLRDLDLSVDFTGNIAPLPDYTPTGLGGENPGSLIADNLRRRGQQHIEYGQSRLQEASQIVVNVNVENNVGDDEKLFDMINEGIRTGRVY